MPKHLDKRLDDLDAPRSTSRTSSGCSNRKGTKLTATLYQGDCLQLMDELEDNSVDMILTDPPYGITRAEWDVMIPFEDMWPRYRRVLKENGACLLFASGRFGWMVPASNPKDWRYDLIWSKGHGTDFLNAKRKPLNSHEHIHVFYRKMPTYNPQMTEGKPYTAKQGNKSKLWGDYEAGVTVSEGYRYPLTVQEFHNENGRHGHSTGKPVPLLEWLIRTYTNEGDIVLDNTMGSGSTGVACMNTGRSFIGMELDSHYFEIAKERIAEAETNADEQSMPSDD